MGLFNLFRSYNINEGVDNYQSTKGAVLLDVRTIEEYREGHIPESQNIPLDKITNISQKIKNKETPLFVYCYSGSRSGQAVKVLTKMGYQNVTNIGGISSYRGKVER